MRYLDDAELEELAARLFASYDEGWAGDAPLTDELIARVEADLGYRLPEDYIALMRRRNGGLLACSVFSYMENDRNGRPCACELLVRGISGIGFQNPCALCGEMGSRFWEAPGNWNYPHIGIYFAEEDSGHGLYALDYRDCGQSGEPSVVNIYHEGFKITRLADNFADFVRRLRSDIAE